MIDDSFISLFNFSPPTSRIILAFHPGLLLSTLPQPAEPYLYPSQLPVPGSRIDAPFCGPA